MTAPPPKRKWLPILRNLAGVVLGAGLLFAVFRKTNWAELRTVLQAVDPAWVALAVGIGIFSHWIRAFRWRLLLQGTPSPAPTRNTFASLMVAYLANNVVPRAGEVVRCTVLTRTDGVPFLTSAGTVVIERILDVLVLLALLGGVFLVESQHLIDVFNAEFAKQAGEGASVGLYGLAALAGLSVLAFVGLLVFRDRLTGFAVGRRVLGLWGTLRDGILSIRRLKHPALFVLSTLGIWLAYTGFAWAMVQAIQTPYEMGWYFAFVATALGAAGYALPSPGGVGTYHVAILLTFALFGWEQSTGKIIALVLHTPQFLLAIVMGLLAYAYLWLGPFRKGPPTPESTASIPSETV